MELGERFTILDLVDVSDKPVVVGGVELLRLSKRTYFVASGIKSPWLQLDLINEENIRVARTIGWAAILE